MSAAHLLLDQHRYDEAIALLTAFGQRVEPPPAAVFHLLGFIMASVGMSEEARECYQAAVQLNPGATGSIMALARSEFKAGDTESAVARLRAARASFPEVGELAVDLHELLMRLGREKEALAVLEPWVNREAAPEVVLLAYAEAVRTPEAIDRAVRRVIDGDRQGPRWAHESSMRLFRVAALQDRARRYDEAFLTYKEANRLRFATFDEAGQQEHLDQYVRAFSRPRFRELAPAPTTERPPIFILGMPRSGTTLIEQIVASHPEVSAGGELLISKTGWQQGCTSMQLSTYLDSDEWMVPELVPVMRDLALASLQRVVGPDVRGTDKMPHSFLWIPLIHKLFPDSPILHCRRDPIDNGVSLFFHNFAGRHDYCYDLHNIGVYYRMYHQLMQTWRDMGCRFLDVQYEDTVADLEGVSRRVLDYCGLSWDERVLRYYESKDTVVKTASWDQVSKPIYKSAVQRWRRYEKHLGPLIEALGDLAVV